MVSREFLDKLAAVIAEAKGGSTDEPFGGLNVILFGDFHQFPPVAGKALYRPVGRAADGEGERIGRALYEQFETVVILKQQMRTQDLVWTNFLRRLRHGACNRADSDMIESLNLRSASCQVTDLDDAEWKDAVLVTPRHAVRRRWNSASVRKHCRTTGQTLYKSRAYDTSDGVALTVRQRFMLAAHNAKRRRQKVERNVDETVELAIGMKVMVTYNVQTEIDIANGARGEIVDIVLHPDEPEHDEGAKEVVLRYPPAYVPNSNGRKLRNSRV